MKSLLIGVTAIAVTIYSIFWGNSSFGFGAMWGAVLVNGIWIDRRAEHRQKIIRQTEARLERTHKRLQKIEGKR